MAICFVSDRASGGATSTHDACMCGGTHRHGFSAGYAGILSAPRDSSDLVGPCGTEKAELRRKRRALTRCHHAGLEVKLACVTPYSEDFDRGVVRLSFGRSDQKAKYSQQEEKDWRPDYGPGSAHPSHDLFHSMTHSLDRQI